jgi:hypothetical protein
MAKRIGKPTTPTPGMRQYNPHRHCYKPNLNLRPDNPADTGCTDFTLGGPDGGETHDNAWITVGNISVHIVRTDEGVVVDLYPKAAEMSEAMMSTYLFFAEAEEALAEEKEDA